MTNKTTKTRRKTTTKKPIHEQCDIDRECAICDADANLFVRAIEIADEMLQQAEADLTGFKESLGDDVPSICMALADDSDQLLTAVGVQRAAAALSRSLDETGHVEKTIPRPPRD